MLSDGVCSVDLSDYNTASLELFSDSGFYINDSYKVAGYPDLDTLFNKQVTQFIDKYEYENTVSK